MLYRGEEAEDQQFRKIQIPPIIVKSNLQKLRLSNWKSMTCRIALPALCKFLLEDLLIAYRIPVFVKYYDESGTFHNDTKYIGMKVSGIPDFVVTLEDDSRAYAGMEGELTISVANRGTATANFLTLGFDSDLAITPAEYYVGNLDPDDYQTVKLNVDFSGVAPGRHMLEIGMHYKDPYNSELSETASVEFKLRQPVAGPVSPLSLAAVVAVAAAAVAAYFADPAAVSAALQRADLNEALVAAVVPVVVALAEYARNYIKHK